MKVMPRANNLVAKLGLNVAQAFYSDWGNFYMAITAYPCALFDRAGYVVIQDEAELEPLGIVIGKRTNVRQRISNLPGYVRFDIESNSEGLRLPVEVAHTSTRNRLAEDLEEITNQPIESTTKDTLIAARVGQGDFRKQVLRLWEETCAVTGSATLDAIRASHIKPWRDSTDGERLDPSNGLPLIANLDALFDAGLISFEASGQMIVSSKLSGAERKIFSIEGNPLTKRPTKKTAAYLEYHRKRYGFDP